MHIPRKFALWTALTIAAAIVAPAAEVEGILIDKMCSAKAVKDGQKAADMHTRECALMPNCAGSGYGVYTKEGRYITFDEAGNKKAEEALQSSKKKDNLRVKVTGEQSGDTIRVVNLKLL